MSYTLPLRLFFATLLLPAYATQAATIVGALEGEATNDMGMLNYRIALELPKGPNGIYPVLGIQYNSAANNGFTLYGTSYITRCNATKKIDGFTAGVRFDSNDRYCLDGTRLVAVKGIDGGVNSEYSLRQKAYSRVTSVNGRTNNPDSWKVATKDGYILHYGERDSAKDSASKGHYRWYLSSKEDRFGNTVVYNYRHRSGKRVLDSIDYSVHSVTFAYRTVSHPIKKYEYGKEYLDNYVLSAITITTNRQRRRTYNFQYQAVGVSAVVRLTAVLLCDGNNNCTKPTTFGWYDTHNIDPRLRQEKTIFSGAKRFLSYKLVDVTADGQDEVCYPEYTGHIVCDGKRSDIGTRYAHFTQQIFATLQFHDINNDGYKDYCMAAKDTGTYCGINTGDGTFLPVRKWSDQQAANDTTFRYIDVNNDQYTDLCTQTKRLLSCRMNNALDSFDSDLHFTIRFSHPRQSFFIDINGDGAVDICGLQNGFSCYLNTNNSNSVRFAAAQVWSSAADFTSDDRVLKNSLRMADFNGDGLPDACYIYTLQLRCAMNNGEQFIDTITVTTIDGNWGPKIEHSASNLVMLDINQDGKVDACIYYNAGDYYCGYNQGNNTITAMKQYASFDPIVDTYHLPGYGEARGHATPITFSDVNGDAKIDVCYHSRSGVSCAISNADAGEHLLKAVISPYNTARFEYSVLTNGDIYKQYTTKVAGMMNIKPSLKALKSVMTNNAAGGTNRLSYRYEGLRYDLEDGMRAFAKIIKVNHPTNPTTISQFHQAGKLNGRVKQSSVFVAGNKVSEHTYQYEVIKEDKTYQIRTTTITAKNYDIDGTLYKTKTIAKSHYDAFANPQRIIERVTMDDDYYELTTHTTYRNDEASWLLSKPITINTVHQHGNSRISKNMAFTYYPNGALKTETKEPGHPLSLITSFQYDAFGNNSKTTMTDRAGNQRNASTRYHTNGINPVTNTNGLGHSETYRYDDFCAQPLTSTGPNGLTTRWQYDALCRPILETRADGTTTQMSYQFSENYVLAIGDVNTAQYKITTIKSGAQPTTVYYDGLGNKVRTKQVGFNGDTILQDTIYNDSGLVAKTTMPYYEGLFAGDNTAWTQYQYDSLGRKTQQIRPASGGDITTTFTYSGNAVTTEDSIGAKRTVLKNVHDTVAQVIDADGTTIINTYDAIGNQLTSRINGRVGARMRYDKMGNTITMDDISMGSWQYTYNAFGERIQQTDAKQQASTIKYDALGRIVSKKTKEGTNYFVYDTAKNAIGKLHKAISPVKTTEYGYDRFARLQTTTDNIQGKQFRHAVTYDDYSRVNKLLYPNSVVINRHYNDYGYLASITMPEAQIWTPELLKLQNILDAYMEKITQLNQQAARYERQARKQIALADRARQSADAVMRQVDADETLARTLRDYAKQYQTVGQYHARKASYFRSQARRYYNQMGHRSVRLIAKYSNGWVKYYGKRNSGKRATSHHYWTIKGYFRHNAWPQYLHIGKMFNQHAARYARYARYYSNYQKHYSSQADAFQHSAATYRQQANELYATAQKHYADARLLTDALRGIVKDKQDYQQAAAVIEKNLNTYLAAVADKEIVIWAATSYDALGRLSGEITGNGVLTRKRYDNLTGQLTSMQSEHGTRLLSSLHYEYNNQNSVTRMVDDVASVTHNYEYDVRDQLVRRNTTRSDNTRHTTTYSYDSFGNMTYKSTVGHMTYNDKNQLMRLSTHNTDSHYSYDANGNMLSGSGRRMQWSSFNKATLITTQDASIELRYDANYQRAVQTVRHKTIPEQHTALQKEAEQKGRWYANEFFKYFHTENITTTYYSANGYEMVEALKNNQTVKKFSINLYAGTQHIGVYVKSLEGNDQQKAVDRLRYFHTDALGNINIITDINGTIVARQQYAAFGTRSQSLSKTVIIDEVKRGYTGHEHIDAIGLINMNARLYDPEIGRFLSADTFIQDPHLTLSHNRYIYVINNPLKYKDPSGHFWHFIVGAVISYVATQVDDPFIRTLGMVVGGAMMGGYFGGEALFANNIILNKMTTGMMMGGINSGTIEGAFIGAVSAGLSYGIGHDTGLPWHDNPLGTAIAHGTAQGILAEASGHTFRDGFSAGSIGHISGAIGEKLIGTIKDDPSGLAIISRTSVAATLGGLSARATGGNVQMGAYQAAMVHLFNKEAGNIKKIIDNTRDAVKHYYSGNGATVELGDNTKSALRNHPDQQYKANKIKTGTTSGMKGHYGVDLTNKIFHVGDTRVNYSTTCIGSICTTTYTGFFRDGFWDPNYISLSSDDGIGPNNELGGTPYKYSPYTWKESYSNPYQ